MSVQLAAPMEALLPETILSSKLGFVFAVPALSAVVIFQATGAFPAENAVPDSLAAFGTRVAAGGHMPPVAIKIADGSGYGRGYVGRSGVTIILGAAFRLLVCGLNVSARAKFFLWWAEICVYKVNNCAVCAVHKSLPRTTTTSTTPSLVSSKVLSQYFKDT